MATFATAKRPENPMVKRPDNPMSKLPESKQALEPQVFRTASSYMLGYDPQTYYDSETKEQFMSESRWQTVVDHCKQDHRMDHANRKMLNQSKMMLGSRRYGPPQESDCSEAKARWVPMPVTPYSAAHNEGLRKSHVDLAVGQDKSCRTWQAEMTEKMGQNATDKFGCRRPEGFQALAAELRQSSIRIEMDTAARGLAPEPRESEQKRQFVPKRSDAARFSPEILKDLRASHFDPANGTLKNCKSWSCSTKDMLESAAEDKWNAQRREPADSAYLRVSSITFGSSKPDYARSYMPATVYSPVIRGKP